MIQYVRSECMENPVPIFARVIPENRAIRSTDSARVCLVGMGSTVLCHARLGGWEYNA